MPSLKQDGNEERSLNDGEVHASAAMMDEEGDFDNNQRSVSVSWDDFGITPLAVTNTNQKSTSDKMKNDRIAKVEEEVNDSDDSVGELEEETTGGRATTTRSRNGSTNEENDTIRTSNESSTKSGNLSNDNTAAKEYGINDATIDYPKEGETHPQEAGALGKSNESALKLVGTGNDSNQRTQYNQSFLSSSTQSNGTLTRSSRNEKQDEYVKKGARVKSLLASALKAVADGLASRSGNSKADEMDAEKHPVKINADFVHVQDLAQKKSQECITLKRQLEECQLQIQCLQNECSASEQNACQAQSKIDRALEALKIAGANAANARAEADAANARAESLSGQLNDLQSLIKDTKECLEIVRREHDEVSHAARSVEGRLIQVESELSRAAKVKRDAEEERDVLKTRAEKSEILANVLQDKVNDYQDEIRHLKKDMVEMDELEKMRSDRTQRIESELQDARAGLLEATSAAAEAESTVTTLRSVIEEVRRDNESLHVQIDDSRNSVSKDRAKQNETLALAEKEAQKWRLKCEEAEEDNRKLKMDKATTEKQVDQLKARITNLERRINEANKGHLQSGVTSAVSELATASEKNAVVTPKNADLGVINAFGSREGSFSTEEANKRKYVSELPMREQSKNPPESFSRQLTYASAKPRPEKDNDPNKNDSPSREGKRPKKAHTNICCLCNREGGMILRCQCDNVNCETRAHPMCIGKFRLGKSDSTKTILCQVD